MDLVMEHILDCHHLVVATPIYFYHLPAPLKALIDRLQPLWVRKVLLRRGPAQKGGLLPVGVGATGGGRLFDGILLTFNCVAPLLGLELVDPMFVRGVDAMGAVENVRGLREIARRKGAELMAFGRG